MRTMPNSTLDILEQKFFAAYQITQRRCVIEQLRYRGVPASELSSTADLIIADTARASAADLRERFPEYLRMAYADRRHWQPMIGATDALDIPVEHLARATAAALARLTVDDIADETRGFNLQVCELEECSHNG